MLAVVCNNCGESEEISSPADADLDQACPYCYAHELVLQSGDGEDFDPDDAL